MAADKLRHYYMNSTIYLFVEIKIQLLIFDLALRSSPEFFSGDRRAERIASYVCIATHKTTNIMASKAIMFVVLWVGPLYY